MDFVELFCLGALEVFYESASKSYLLQTVATSRSENPSTF